MARPLTMQSNWGPALVRSDRDWHFGESRSHSRLTMEPSTHFKSPVNPASRGVKLTVAVAQMKFRSTTGHNLEWIVAAIQSAAAEGADVVVFPECAVTGYNRDFAAITETELAEARALISRTARAAGCYVLVGTPVDAGRNRFNSLLVYNRRGREIFCYSKIHLTRRDRQSFQPGNQLAFFRLDGIPCTAILCHERRYPELVRLPVMLGARIVFHPNAGLDSLAVSRTKRGGRDGIAVRAFENQVFNVFANSVGPQGDDWWSAGDSKIVAPSGRVLAQANHRNAGIIRAELNLAEAGRQYAREALVQPAFLRPHWRRVRPCSCI